VFRRFLEIRERLDDLTDAEMLALHRDVSRRAQTIRAKSPKYQQNYRAGMAAARHGITEL
jgi:hypothetical protein